MLKISATGVLLEALCNDKYVGGAFVELIMHCIFVT